MTTKTSTKRTTTKQSTEQDNGSLSSIIEAVIEATNDKEAETHLARFGEVTDGMLRRVEKEDKATLPAALEELAPVFVSMRRDANTLKAIEAKAEVRKTTVKILLERKILGTKGFNQTDVARMLGCSQPNIAQLKRLVEKGSRQASRDKGTDKGTPNVTSTPDTDPTLPGPAKPETATAVWVAEQVHAFLATMPDAVVPDGPEDRAALAGALDALTEWASSVA